MARQRRAQVLFCTATLPPLDDGLGDHGPARPLVDTVPPVLSRFTIRSASEPWNADRVAAEARQRLKSLGSVAVILNTVRDAVDVFRKLRHSAGRWFFLASRMLPGHKEWLIRRIRKVLKESAGPLGVVCTQVLEAGVDLSFRAILRARPVFPSIVQAAGRGNRHGEGTSAEVLVFDFIRDDGQETRQWVYRDKTANQQTDRILQEAGEIPETDVACWLEEYYRRCWEANPHTTSLLAFEAAAQGKWSELAGKEPFQEDLPGRDVLVPGAERFLPRRYQQLLGKFVATTAEGFLKHYLDPGTRPGLSFTERRLRSALLRQFLVEVPTRYASRVSHPVNEIEWPLVLDRKKDYRMSTGLAHLLCEEDEGDGTKVC